MDIKFNDQFSATVQGVTSQRTNGSYKPHFEWAFVKYKPTSDWDVRMGIMAGPYFDVSDYINVGYGQPFVRPPSDVYLQVPFTNFKGIDTIYKMPVGDGILATQVGLGITRDKIALGGVNLQTDADKVRTINATYEVGDWAFRVGYTVLNVSLASTTVANIVGGLNAYQPMFPSLDLEGYGKSFSALDKKASFMGLGVNYTHDDLWVKGEYTKRKTDSYISNTIKWYLASGYRLNNITPYVIYSNVNVNGPRSQDVVPTTGPLAALGVGLNKVIASQVRDQSTSSIGVRYDFMKNMDLKLQLDHTRMRDTKYGPGWGYPSSSYNPSNNSYNVVTLSTDFVF
jgi:hypothetical protein